MNNSIPARSGRIEWAAMGDDAGIVAGRLRLRADLGLLASPGAGVCDKGAGMAAGQVITLRLSIEDPLPGVAYSLQNKKSEPVAQITAGHGPISFDVPVRVAPGRKFYGDFVRSEGPSRCFVYLAIGEQAGQRPSEWSRRAKVDIHLLAAELLEKALGGHILEARLPGKAKDGSPACATLLPIEGWKIVE